MDLKKLVLQTAFRAGVPTTAIEVVFRDHGEQDGGFGWTFSVRLSVTTGKPKKKGQTVVEKVISGLGDGPESAADEMLTRLAEWRNPKATEAMRAAQRQQALLTEMAQEDAVLADKLRAKGIIP